MKVSASCSRNYLKSLQDSNLAAEEFKFKSVFAPVVFEFAKWAVNEASEAGIERLYFLARDAYFPYLAAKEIVKNRNLNIDIRYLYVSRYSLRTAEFALDKKDCIDTVCIGGIDVTFHKIMQRAGLSDEEGKAFHKLSGYTKAFDEVLNKSDIQEVKELLRSCPEFLETVNKKSSGNLPKVLGYLEGEGLFDDIKFAVVDSGWVGGMQLSLANILSAKKDVKVPGYYFGLYELPKGVNSADYHSFYFRPYKDICKKVRFSNCLFETVMSAPTGMTLGYEKTVEGYRPVFETQEGLNKGRILTYEAWVKEYVTDAVAGGKDDSNSAKVLKRMARLMEKPSVEEVNAFGDLKFCDDVLENTVLEIAAFLTDKEIKHINNVKSGWTEGSIVRNGKNVALRLLYLRLYKWISYLRKLFLHMGNR